MKNEKIFVHVDADTFFVSCERLANPRLLGRPVVTGGERGVVSALSAEAKMLGITRGMPIATVRRASPECVIVASDFALYRNISMRMVSIMQSYTDHVEYYSIDECFADMTYSMYGWKSTEHLARHIKYALETQLGIPFSVGIAPTKVLAKMVSTYHKPSACAVLSSLEREGVLRRVAIGTVWGVGRKMERRFHSYGIRTAYRFTTQDRGWVFRHFPKPYRDLWYELCGVSVLGITMHTKDRRTSVMRSKTFSVNSSDRAFVLSRLVDNFDRACRAVRRYGMEAKKVCIFLRHSDMFVMKQMVSVTSLVSSPLPHISALEKSFDDIFNARVCYRASGVILESLMPREPELLSCCASKKEKIHSLYKTVDRLTQRFGRQSICIGVGMFSLPDRRREIESRQKRVSVLPLSLGEI